MKVLVAPTLNVSLALSMPSLGTVPEEIQVSIAEARHIQLAYTRKFAGKARATRDARLLQEMAERLRGLHSEILSTNRHGPAVDRALATIASHIATFAVELQQIRTALQSAAIGLRLSWTIDCLNEQLTLYQRHFATLPRLSRSVRLLQRSLARLNDILEMVDGSLLLFPRHDRLLLCKERARAQVKVAKEEIAHIQRVQAVTSSTERLQAILLDVQFIRTDFQLSFVGHPRADANLEALGQLCDRLHEDELQIANLVREHCCAGAAEVLPRVQRLLDAYEIEYQRIQSAYRRRPP